jgi:hypothetical protein
VVLQDWVAVCLQDGVVGGFLHLHVLVSYFVVRLGEALELCFLFLVLLDVLLPCVVGVILHEVSLRLGDSCTH